MGEVAKIETQHSTALTPMDMLQIAVEQNADIDKLTKLMDLNERWEASKARQAFNEAIAAFQAEAPTIGKTRSGHNTKYAGLAETLEQVRAPMARHGLSHSWETQQDGNAITVTCWLTHAQGHRVSTTLTGAPDGTGSKNAIQAVGSTVSYLQRYTLFAVLGLASREQDDDGTGADKDPITDDQKQKIIALIKDVGADTKAFCKYMRVEAVDQIPAQKFDQAMKALEQKRTKK